MDTPRDLPRLLALCRQMADVIDRYQAHMKPREADKARQARRLIKKLTKGKYNEQVLRSKSKV